MLSSVSSSVCRADARRTTRRTFNCVDDHENDEPLFSVVVVVVSKKMSLRVSRRRRRHRDQTTRIFFADDENETTTTTDAVAKSSAVDFAMPNKLLSSDLSMVRDRCHNWFNLLVFF